MYNQLLLRKKLTSFLFEEREKSLPSPNRSIIPIDIPQDIVLSHAVRIHLCCWSLTADSHSLYWAGHIIQDKVQFQICQGGQCQNNHGTKDDNDRSKNWFPQTC